MKIFFTLLAALVLSSTLIYAQDSIPPELRNRDMKYEDFFPSDTEKYVNLFNNGVGVSFSTMSGYGISYLKRMFNYYSLLLTGFITYDEHLKWSDMSKTIIELDEKNILYDFGIEIQRDIFTSTRTKIFVLIGSSYSVERKKNQFSFYNDYTDSDKKIFSLGVGFGLQWYMAKQFAGYFHFGYRFENTDGKEDGKPVIERKTTVGIGLGLLFLF